MKNPQQASLSKQKFRQFIAETAWETEIWIAENPDHLVHFNGEKLLGLCKGYIFIFKSLLFVSFKDTIPLQQSFSGASFA